MPFFNLATPSLAFLSFLRNISFFSLFFSMMSTLLLARLSNVSAILPPNVFTLAIHQIIIFTVSPPARQVHPFSLRSENAEGCGPVPEDFNVRPSAVSRACEGYPPLRSFKSATTLNYREGPIGAEILPLRFSLYLDCPDINRSD